MKEVIIESGEKKVILVPETPKEKVNYYFQNLKSYSQRKCFNDSEETIKEMAESMAMGKFSYLK